jgi:hypothetical protein
VKCQEKSEKKVKKSRSVPERKNLESPIEEEERRIQWLRVQVDVTRAILYQDPELDLETAREMVLELRRKVLKQFPGKEDTFDLILLPRFERILRERWGGGLVNEGTVQ